MIRPSNLFLRERKVTSIIKVNPGPVAFGARIVVALESANIGVSGMVMGLRRSGAKRPAVSSVASQPKEDEGHDYSGLLAGVQSSFELVSSWPGPFFQTDAPGLSELYLIAMPSARQHHNCSACRRFLETYGGLVVVTDSGNLESVMWKLTGGVPDFYVPVFEHMRERVERAKIVAPFLTKEHIWGTPKTGNWSHMAVLPEPKRVYRPGALTPGQAMASAKENFRIVNDALKEFSTQMLDQALRLFESDSLSYSEKFKGPVFWLRKLHERPRGRKGENLLWRAVATAPAGYCHPKSSVIAPLLQDIVNGLPFEDLKRKFNAKVAPLKYQRAQVAPTAGNLASAEKLIEKLGLRKSLERRFARLNELEKIWFPYAPASKAASAPGAIFGHLTPKATGKGKGAPVPPVALPERTMTWEKFIKDILPGAEQMEFQVPIIGSFIALTSAVHLDAPDLFKWDGPIAWYVYPKGSRAEQWRLSPGWAPVTAVVPLPTLWGKDPKPYIAEGAVIVLKGACDTHNTSNALFASCLRGDLHEIRSAMEAYSLSARLSGQEQASACGYDCRKDNATGRLRVLASGIWSHYFIDRWE